MMDRRTFQLRTDVADYFFTTVGGYFHPWGKWEGQRIRLQPVEDGPVSYDEQGAVYSVPAAVLHAVEMADDDIAAMNRPEMLWEIAGWLEMSYTWASLFERTHHKHGAHYIWRGPEDVMRFPDNILGASGSRILKFWRILDQLSVDDWLAVNSRRLAMVEPKRSRYRDSIQVGRNRHYEPAFYASMDGAQALLEQLQQVTPNDQLATILADDDFGQRGNCALATRMGYVGWDLIEPFFDDATYFEILFERSRHELWPAREEPDPDDSNWHNSQKQIWQPRQLALFSR